MTSLEASYHISAVAAIWISLIALLSGAAFVPTLCRLGDTMGWKKSLAIAGLACLALGGLIAAVSDSLPLLLLGRAITGVGLVMFPMLAGIVNEEFPVVRRKIAISLISATLFLGLGIGGVIAGLIVEHHASFRIVFWGSAILPFLTELTICMTIVGIGIGMVVASFGLIYVEDIPPEHVGRLFGISPILATGVGGSIGGAVFGAFLTSNTLPPVPGAPPGPPLPSIQAFEGFWPGIEGTLPTGVAAASD